MSFLNAFRNLHSFFSRQFSRLHEYLYGPAPVPPINVTIVHVTHISLDPKDTIEGVSEDLSTEEFRQAIGEAFTREIIVAEHNRISDKIINDTREEFAQRSTEESFY